MNEHDLPMGLPCPTTLVVEMGPRMPSKSISLLYTTARTHLIDEVINRWLPSQKDSVEMIVVTDDPIECTDVRPDVHYAVNTGRRDCVTGWNLAAHQCTGQILVQVSDDLFPPNGWENAISVMINEMLTVRKDIVLNLLDERKIENAVYHPVLTRESYDKLQYMYPPDFESMYCDNWFFLYHRKYSYYAVSKKVFWEHKHRTTHSVEIDDVMRTHESSERYLNGRATLQRYVRLHNL